MKKKTALHERTDVDDADTGNGKAGRDRVVKRKTRRGLFPLACSTGQDRPAKVGRAIGAGALPVVPA